MVVKIVNDLILLLVLFDTKFSSVFGGPSVLDNKLGISPARLYVELESEINVGYKGHSAVIPCQPTSPEYIVTLYGYNSVSKMFEKVHLDSRISFDPNVGFTIRHINSNDRQRYKCEFKTKTNGEPQFLKYYLTIFDAPIVKIVNTPKCAVKGDKFNFECRIFPLNDMIINDYVVQWRAPNGTIYPQDFLSPDERISTVMAILDTVEGTSFLQIQNIKSSLKIQNIDDNDAGTYKCEFESWDLQLEATTTVDVSAFGCPLESNNEVETSSARSYIQLASRIKAGFEGHSAVIPCLPTSPQYDVILSAFNSRSKMYEKIHLDSRISFDPYVGFTIQHINSKDGRQYKCEFKTAPNEDPESFIFTLNVFDPPTVKIVNTPKHAIEGDDFNFECQIDLLNAMITNYFVQWRAPNGNIYPPDFSSSDGKICTSTDIMGKSDKKLSLKIKNITFSDAGMYKCEFQSWDLQLEATTTVTVSDSQLVNVYLNLPSVEKNYTYATFGQDKEISATIVTTSNNLEGIQVNWTYTAFNNPIVTNNKYQVTTTRNGTKLVIKNVDESDGGNYTVWVINGHKIWTAHTFLRVPDRTVKFTTKFNLSYKPFTEIQIKSWIGRPPLKDITWYFQKYIDSGNGNYEDPVLLKDFSVNNSSMRFMTSTVSLNLTQTGIVICKACFLHLCDSQNQTIVVADDKLETTKFEDVVLEGSNVNTTCSASSYYYSNITWQKANGQIINETDRIKIALEKKKYTHKSTMEIKSVKKSDDTTYKCVAVAKNGSTFWKKEKLSIEVKKMPILINSNMNGSKSVFDEEKARRITIQLTCYVNGLPKPTISWLKDGELIVQLNSTVYEFFNETQELHIVHPEHEHSGRYVCKAHNDYEEKEVSHSIVIAGNHVIMSIILGTMIPFIACMIFGIYYMTVRRSKEAKKIEIASQVLANFEEGDLENLHSKSTADDQALCLPYDKQWEFTRENLKLQKRLGSGQFGVVMKAKANGICERDTVTTVAVKMGKKSKSPMYLKVLVSELKMLSYIGRHLNIVNLLGACSTNISRGELLVIVEYCRYGNLQSFLRKHRDNFVNQIDPASMEQNGQFPDGRGSGESLNEAFRKRRRDHLITITIQHLLAWAFQTAQGMLYLSQKKILHGDLAARNVLLADNNVIKICDFGLARNLYHYEIYQKTTNDPLPLKWMAIESIRDRVFSTKSDVWSFGIFLWEVFTLACTPYPEFTSQEVYQKLIEGYRMGKSEYMTDEIYNVMLQCWNADPTLRPTFSNLARTIGSMLPKSVATHFIELNSPYVRFNETEDDGIRDHLAPVSRPDLRVHISRSNDQNGHVTVDLADAERRASDVSSASSGQVPNATGSSDTTHSEPANLPSCSHQPVNVPANHSRTSRTVTFLRSMLIGRIIGFKNPYYISADKIVES